MTARTTAACISVLFSCLACVPTEPEVSTAPADTTATPSSDVLRFSAQEWQSAGLSEAEYPVRASYDTFNQRTRFSPQLRIDFETANQEAIYFASECDPAQIGRIIEMITAEGDRRQRSARGPLATSQITADVLGSAKGVYRSAQNACGYDYADAIQQLDAAERQARDNMFELSSRSNQPRGNFNMGNFINVLSGIASVAAAANGYGGDGGSVPENTDPCMQRRTVTQGSGTPSCR